MLSKNTEIYNTLSNKYGIHKAVIQMICNHPFIFTSRRMSDPDDEKSMMFSYLFKISLKNRFKNKKKITNERSKERKMLFRDSLKRIQELGMHEMLSEESGADEQNK